MFMHELKSTSKNIRHLPQEENIKKKSTIAAYSTQTTSSGIGAMSTKNSKVKSVHASGVSVISDTPDIANARLEFENGCVANLTSSRISISRTRKFRIFCEDSYLSLDLGAGTFERYGKDPLEKDLAKAISHESGSLRVEDALQEEIRDFVNAVRNGGRPLVSGEDGLRAIEVAERVVADVKGRMLKISALPPGIVS
jgi:predicted dehydrogenase